MAFDTLEVDSAAKGIKKNRACRDVLFLLAFIAFWAGSWTIAGISLDYGDPRRLYFPKDTYNHTCGLSAGYENKTRLYWPDPWYHSTDVQICVEACPDSGLLLDAATYLALVDNPFYIPIPCSTNELICTPNITNPSNNDFGRGCWCPYESTSVLRRCMPGNATQAAQIVQSKVQGRQEFNQAFGDLVASWDVILGFAFLSLVLCFVWLVLVTWISGFMVWWTVIAFIGIMIISCAYLWSVVNEQQSQIDNVETEAPSFVNKRKALQGIAIAWTVVTIVAVVVVVWLRDRINLAVAIVKEASKAVGAMPLVVFFPIVCFAWLVLFFAWWFAIAMYLASFDATLDPRYTQKNLDFMKFYHLFSFFWNTQFIIAFLQVVIAGAIASYYWAQDKTRDVPAMPVFASVERTIRYHLGSVAFGSLLLAIIETIRTIIMWFQHQAKKSGNKALEYVLCVVQCLVSCVERFLKFFNRNAYIMIAVYGGSFCGSARRAFKLIVNNVVRVAIVSWVGEYIMLLGKFGVSVTSGLLASAVLRQRPEITFWVFPVIFVMAFAFFLSSAFFSVYEMAIDTILLCFLDESDQIEKNQGGPLYMSADLKAFIDDVHKKQTAAMGEAPPAKSA
eukprot:TRINITY_DN15147_c0_g1_i1.p1 TRINITY_DN15147_c0_g1~~TRINITY_DN15147_c0_g1_i1.p1  ORF type:complete len:618 (-),score=145.68 TRINITY_DN15147_c0_g1_i1:69-1922(-)